VIQKIAFVSHCRPLQGTVCIVYRFFYPILYHHGCTIQSLPIDGIVGWGWRCIKGCFWGWIGIWRMLAKTTLTSHKKSGRWFLWLLSGEVAQLTSHKKAIGLILLLSPINTVTQKLRYKAIKSQGPVSLKRLGGKTAPKIVWNVLGKGAPKP
jgi:hypothetical protein